MYGLPVICHSIEISLLSQIISVADSWHAMTSKRSYKNQLTCEEAIGELIKNKGTQFAPEIINTFINVYNSREDAFMFEKSY